MVKEIKIAISGKANSGKNTVATLLGTYIRYKDADILDTKTFAFADPIKEMVMQMLPMTERRILWGPSELRITKVPNSEVTYRQLLLDLGKLGRSYDPNIWINATVHMANFFAQTGIAIIADVRFKNEFQAMKNEKFFLIRVIRPNCAQTSTSNDISEVDLDDIPDSAFHCVLVNDGSMTDLQDKIREIVATHF